MKRLTHLSFNESVAMTTFKQFDKLLLADPSFKKHAKIDIIIGAVELAQIIKPGLVKTHPQRPIAQDTEFGWIISGPVNAKTSNKLKVVTLISNIELDEKIRNFFDKSDILDISNQNDTDEDIECEKHFLRTYKQCADGRYMVKMPFKKAIETPDLGDSRKVAVAAQL